MLLVALRRPSWAVPLITLGLVQMALHTLNHVLDAGEADPSWVGPFDAVALGLTAVGLVLVLRLAAPGARPMRVFVAGATGVIGRPLVALLLEAGHDVAAMTRSAARAAALRAQGVDAVVADALDPDGTRRAVVAARPEVVVHQLTDLPARIDLRHYERDVGPTSHLREVTGPLFARAAREAGARRLVAQSVSFVTAPQGPPVLDETAPTAADAPGAMGRMARAVVALERAVTGAEALEGVVLRYGFFYGPGNGLRAGGSFVEDVRRRRLPIVGAGTGLALVRRGRRRRGRHAARARPRGARDLQRHRRRARSPSASGCASWPTRSVPRPRAGSRCGSRACSSGRWRPPR